MTGMKEGAGEDPFAEDPGPTSADPDDQSSTESSASADEADSSDAADSTDAASDQATQSIQIPYKFRRDGVQDGRNRVPLFLHEETQTAERDALRELEDRFGDDVSLTDLREGLVKAGLQHLDEVETQLEEWGYGMTFDE
jgi:hypothetical protein